MKNKFKITAYTIWEWYLTISLVIVFILLVIGFCYGSKAFMPNWNIYFPLSIINVIITIIIGKYYAKADD